MKKLLFSIAFISLFFLGAGSSNAETDIRQFINEGLSGKENVTRTRMVIILEQDCPWSGEAELPRCRWERRSVEQRYAAKASVKNGFAVEVLDFRYHEEKKITLPEKALIGRVDYYNCGPGIFSTSHTVTLSGSKGWSVSKTKSVSSSLTVSLTGNMGLGGIGSGSLSVSQSVSLSQSTTNTESWSDSDSRSTTISISVAHGEAGNAEVVAFQSSAIIPFSARIIVDGDMDTDIVGPRRASELLSIEERTLEFEGAITITGMSDIRSGNNPPATPFRCGDLRGSKVTPTYFEAPADDLHEDFTSRIVPIDVMYAPKIAGATIGAPDGIHYRIVSSSVVSEPTPACGFNDALVPNWGDFVIEQRLYEHYLNGTLIASWSETVRNFKGCRPGP